MKGGASTNATVATAEDKQQARAQRKRCPRQCWICGKAGLSLHAEQALAETSTRGPARWRSDARFGRDCGSSPGSHSDMGRSPCVRASRQPPRRSRGSRTLATRALTRDLPRFVVPMLARTGPVPVGAGWAVEVKFDGMRLQRRSDRHAVCLRSRPDATVRRRFPRGAPIGGALGSHRVLLDGELVCLGADGSLDFAGLRRRLRARPIGRADMPGAGRPPFWRSICFTPMAARRASFPMSADASCCLSWGSTTVRLSRRPKR
jgi:hypothetical protein